MTLRGAPAPADTLTRGAVFGILAEALVLPTGLVSAAILTRALGLELYGLVGVAIAVIAPTAWVLTSIIGARSGLRIISGSADPVAAASALLRINVAIGLAGALIFALSAPVIAALLGRPELQTALMIGSAEILLLPVARSHRDALVGTGHYSHAGLTAAVFHLVRLAAIAALVLGGLKVEAVMCAIVLGRIAEILWCRRRLPVPLWRRHDLRAEGLLALLGPTFLYALCLRLAGSADILMLTGYGAGDAALSHFAAAQMLGQIPGMAVMVLVPQVLAAVTQARASGDAPRGAALLDDAYRLTGVIVACLLVAAGGAPGILRVIFGADFIEAAPLFGCLMIGGVGFMALSLGSAELLADDRPRAPLIFAVPLLVATIGLQALVIPRYWEFGAAVVSGGVQLVVGCAALLALRQTRSRRFAVLARALVAGAAGGLLAAALGPRVPVLTDAVAGGVLAAGLLFALGVIDRDIVGRFRSGLSRGPGRAPVILGAKP